MNESQMLIMTTLIAQYIFLAVWVWLVYKWLKADRLLEAKWTEFRKWKDMYK